jgi:bifunctional enzyme CysN/CysC
MSARETMNVVIVGHVDHGKSTLIGRLLADTGSLPEGKLAEVRQRCALNAKPFEYAFLLDALKDEQAQGITIDAARCFFKTRARDYLVIDAPGHLEFLKNMVTGASRAEAALLVVDAEEGVRENSRRHGLLLSLLGVRQIVAVVNKMDLVGYSQAAFEAVEHELGAFLGELGIQPVAYTPVSAFQGENLTRPSEAMPWYTGGTVLQIVDRLVTQKPADERPFRLPVQDVYKFTEDGDDRRIVAGTVVAGAAEVGDEIVFLPSGKRAAIASVEAFAEPTRTRVSVDEAVGLTLATELYVQPGQIACRVDEPAPEVGSIFRASVFWLGKSPLACGKRYKLKLGTASTSAYLREVVRVVDASDLSLERRREHVERHEVGECIFETMRPLAFDRADASVVTSRFVIVDDYEIAGGGIITERVERASMFEERAGRRKAAWALGGIAAEERHARYRQKPKLLVITGEDGAALHAIGTRVERALFDEGRFVYLLGVGSLEEGLGADVEFESGLGRDEHIRRLGELAQLFADAGCILVAAVPAVDRAEIHLLRLLSAPSEVIVVGVDDEKLAGAAVALRLGSDIAPEEAAQLVLTLRIEQEVIIDYQI